MIDRLGFGLLICLFASCGGSKLAILRGEAKQAKIQSDKIGRDPVMDSFLKPYQEEFHRKMMDTLAFSSIELTRSGKKNTLGQWAVEAMQWYTDSVIKSPTDLALINSGGLRTKSLPIGAIRRKDIYELMPFDNQLVILEIDSAIIDSLIPHIRAGWPKSESLRISKFNDASEWHIIKKTSKAKFSIVVSDFIANGGDKMYFLKSIPQKQTHKLFRDILLEYASYQKQLKLTSELK